MKQKLFLIFLFVGIICTAQTSDNVTWHTNIEKALEKASKEEKKVLIYFSGSDWCKPCIELKKEVFATDIFKNKANKEFVLVNIDFPRNRRKLPKEQRNYIEQAAEKYNSKGAFPMVAVLNSKGKMLTSIDGYKSESASYYIENYLK